MKNFCVMPWYSRETNLASGSESVCCWIRGNISRRDLQQKFIAGENPQECQKCWDSERLGVESRRQMENRFLDFKMNRDIELIERDAVEGPVEFNMYQLFLGSTCNSTCVTCGSGASSAWRALHKDKFSIQQENSVADQNFESFSQSTNWKNAKRVNLLGGEPLLIKRSFDILKKILDAGNTDCRIAFVTNGSVTLTKKQIELIREFSDISCCLSIDGTDKTFEYLRYPLSWQKLLDNLNMYREIFTEVVVSFTISNLNYHERDNIIQWFQDQKLPYIENYVTSPACFAHSVDPSHALWPNFVKEVAGQDQLKGIKIGDYLPYVADLIALSGKKIS